MKRAILALALEKGPTYELEVPEPGIVRNVLMGMRERKIAPPSTDFLSAVSKPVVEEVATIVFEVDPSEGVPTRKRRFTIVKDVQTIESDNVLEYCGMLMSQNGMVWSLWEEKNVEVQEASDKL